MNIKKLLVLAPVAVLSLTSCNASKRYSNDKYQLDLTWDTATNSTFNILQLTDLHMSNVADKEKHFNFIRKTVEEANKVAKIDLIAITGDIFTFAEKKDAREVFNFFNSLEKPWAPTFGNHDEQVYFTVDWMTSLLNELNDKRVNGEKSYCVFKDLQDDDIFGNANYVINLKDTSKKLIEQLYFFDSNRYNFEYRGYDYIHYDQIDWYERQLSEVEDDVRSLAFFHIPFPEFEENYQIAKGGKNEHIYFNKGIAECDHDDGTGDPKVNTGLYSIMKKHGNTNGVFIGHNHTSNYVVDEEYEGVPESGTFDKKITLAFGIKSTNRVYCDKEKLGGQIIKIYQDDTASGGTHKQGDIEITRVFNKYDE